MKKYLMTWYGMTDFRVSLGLEQTTGPVLGALLAEDYTDVIILGFTHPDKSKNKTDEFQQKIAEIEDYDALNYLSENWAAVFSKYCRIKRNQHEKK